MKVALLSITALFMFTLNAQTALIAHKSHSGSIVSYIIDPNSNFGRNESMDAVVRVLHEPESTLPYDKSVKWRWLNDSTLVREIYENETIIEHDTMISGIGSDHHNLQLQVYLNKKRDEILDSIRQSEDSIMLQHRFRISRIIGTPKRNTNDPSFLLVLFSVSAVLMILVRLIVRERKPSVI